MTNQDYERKLNIIMTSGADMGVKGKSSTRAIL